MVNSRVRNRMNFMHVLLSNEKFYRKLKVAFFLILALAVSIFSMSLIKKEKLPEKPFQLTVEERIWLGEFFEDFLFDSPGAYTLFGSKPVSGSCLYHKHFSEEEKKELEKYLASLPDESKRPKRHDFEANYDKWMAIKDRFPIRQYLFGEFPTFDEKTSVALFVNIEAAIKTVVNHYEEFRRTLGYDFDPVQAIFDVQNKESKFWNAVVKNHLLMGIMHGFGRENSYFFDQFMKYNADNSQIGDFFRSMPKNFSDNKDIRYQDVKNFMLPIFKTFGLFPNDFLINQYETERKRIKAIYKGKDSVDVALSWLTR